VTDGAVTDGAVGRAWLQASAQPLASAYDVGLLDLDGVVYVGQQAIAGVPEILRKVRDAGMRLAFVTNNASRAPSEVSDHLVDLGIPSTPDDVVTSSQAAVRLVVERIGPNAAVLVTGSPALRDIVEAAGLRAVSSADDRPDAVVQGFSSQLRYADLAEAALAVHAGALWVATNTDSTLPSPRGLLPGNGSLVGVVAVTTGRTPVVAGKPELPLHAEGVRRTAARAPLVVGDRLDTDIEGANLAKTPSLLVLTGVTSGLDLLSAPPRCRPTYLTADLSGLLESQPQVEVDGSTARCQSCSVRQTADDVEISGAGPEIDTLRALLALVWSQRDMGADSPGAVAAVRRLALC
jgi:glycerol-1-phosphatase